MAFVCAIKRTQFIKSCVIRKITDDKIMRKTHTVRWISSSDSLIKSCFTGFSATSPVSSSHAQTNSPGFSVSMATYPAAAAIAVPATKQCVEWNVPDVVSTAQILDLFIG